MSTILFLLAALMYFLPALVASQRSHQNCLAITVLNVLGGWTILGWIVAMVWACTEVTPEKGN